MTTKSMRTSITGMGFPNSLVPLPIDRQLHKAQENGILAETVIKMCEESMGGAQNELATTNQQVRQALEKIRTTPTKETPLVKTNKVAKKAPSLKNWLMKNFNFTPYLNGEKIPESVAKDLHKQAQHDGLKVTFQSTVTDIYRLRRDLSKEKNSLGKKVVEQEIELSSPPVSQEEMPPMPEKPAPPVVEKTIETAPIATAPTTITEMVAKAVAKQKQLRAKTEELLAEAARLEEEAKAEAEFEEFLKGVESLPNANAYLPKMLAHFQR